ncbi:baseplate multidomain protein megatron [Nitratireductor thuwali]|uniref:Host specificity protein n=1 Tax=Nitratireductor thuwali TaxID=2267699 RepID=A0ABY5MSV3_9HYPH|nr:hypothetical protein NTH_03412 [Nitratireductor thuwali]
MATIVLQAAGAFLGGVLGPVGSAIGSAAGALAGYAIDRALIEGTKRYEGPRLGAARPFSAEDGAPLPRVYGTMRIGGTLIWATRFEEASTTTRQGGKGGPKVTTYSYFANAAFALCQGEIAGVRRIWADGREIDQTKVEIRVYRGGRNQPVDPLIEAKQGAGNAPAYRGTAYAVIERLPIDEYGNRLPQFQFEVVRTAGLLNERVRSVALIPGATEYGLSPTLVTKEIAPGETEAVNRHTLGGGTDLDASLDELQALCPNLKTVSLVVTWFGTDLRAAACRIEPMVTQASPGGLSQSWFSSGISRAQARVVSQVDGRAAFGGTPSDRSVMDAISAIRGRGLKVALYPFIMMDVPPGNGLPDPYGGAAQAVYPWRGRISCHPAPGQPGTVDKTPAARVQIENLVGNAEPGQFSAAGDTIPFVGSPGEWSYRRFILHYAHLAVAAGGVDGFLLGSELRGLTAVRENQNRFPFVEALEALAGEVRALIGEGPVLTYGADWTEYFGHQPADGSGDVFFHLDSLWAHPAINSVAIDNYMPLSDWRDEDIGGGNPDGFASPYDIERMRAAITSGEGFDWYYASAADRAARLRTPISDGAYGEPWVYRYKDLKSWWSNQHFNRIGGVQQPSPTAWQPKSKPIHFTELGCAAVDKGPNQPNVFPDPKSSENALPYFSSGGRSDMAQYALLSAHYDHWLESGEEANPVSPVYGGTMVDTDEISIWAWDARPFPSFPLFADTWGDGANWTTGHWLNGRLSGVALRDLIQAVLADHGLPPADTDGVDGMVSGYLVAQPATARAVLDPLVGLFRLSVRETAEGLVFATEGASAGEAAIAGDRVLPADSAVVERVRRPDHEMPKYVQVDFRDEMNEHRSATAAAGYLGAEGNGTSYVGFPGVLPQEEAERLADDWVRRLWAGREQVRFSLPLQRQAIHPGTVLKLDAEGPEYVVEEVEDGLVRSVRARRLVRIAPSTPAKPLPDRSQPPVYADSRPHALMLDLPLRGGSDKVEDQLRIAARARPWKTQALLASPEDTGFELRTTLPQRATMGTLVTALPMGAAAGRIDRSAAVDVRLLDGELASVSRTQLLSGANAAAIRSHIGIWEIVQFEAAEEVSAGTWHLTGLLRGQLGTDDAMAAGAEAGSPFVLLDDAVAPAGLRPSEIGLELNWRVGHAGGDISADAFTQVTAAGGLRALTPLSPVHLAGRAGQDGLAVNWIRRGRIDGDSWLGEDIPLGEAQELYRIDVAPPGGSPVRSETVGNSQWNYTIEMAIDDFGTLPETVEITVRQISETVGPGLPARRAFAVG